MLEAALARLQREPVIPAGVPDDVRAVIRAMTARRPADRPDPAEVELAFRRIVIGHLGEPSAPPRLTEADRVAALRRYDLLDTPPDGGFDRITALAARSLDMPVAVVGLADEDRLWFKSRIGVECAQLSLPIEGLRDGGVVARTTVLQAQDGLPVAARTAGLAVVVAVPLMTTEGANLGVLAVADRIARRPTERELATLEDLAALVVHEMELRLAVRRAVLLRGPG